MPDSLNPTMTDVLGWDVRTWSQAVECWSEAVEAAPPTLRCLEVGAGPGGPALWLAKLGHNVVCTNLDNTREQAAPLHDRFGVSERIEYRDIDLREGLPYRDEFDVIIFKSVLGGLGKDPQFAAEVMREIRAALKPGGLLLFAENLRGAALHRAARWMAYRVRGTSWRYPALTEIEQLLGEFSEVTLRTAGFSAVLGPNESIRAALAKADRALLDRVVPRRWHYVVFGIAKR